MNYSVLYKYQNKFYKMILQYQNISIKPPKGETETTAEETTKL